MNRNMRYYDRHIRNKGQCYKCFGPCQKYSKECAECQRKEAGKRLAGYAQRGENKRKLAATGLLLEIKQYHED